MVVEAFAGVYVMDKLHEFPGDRAVSSCVDVLEPLHPCKWYTGRFCTLWCCWFVDFCFSDIRVCAV